MKNTKKMNCNEENGKQLTKLENQIYLRVLIFMSNNRSIRAKVKFPMQFAGMKILNECLQFARSAEMQRNKIMFLSK
jgi:hypothetical protein